MSINAPPTASRAPHSRQRAPHADLQAVVQKHLDHPYLAPLHAPSVAALEQLTQRRPDVLSKPLVLDAGCGTGESTSRLAERHPDALVLGVDRSEHRLRRGRRMGPTDAQQRALWVQADLVTAWRWLLQQGVRLEAHYLLYPNPWPKRAQLKRRWHAHPVFPDILALGGKLEMRCNWKVFADEFALALQWATGSRCPVQPLTVTEPISAFEAKYAASGLPLWQVLYAAPVRAAL